MAKAFAVLTQNDKATIRLFEAKVVGQLSSTYASTQIAAGLVAENYAAEAVKGGFTSDLAPLYSRTLVEIVTAERQPAYRDLVNYVQRVRTQCQQLLHLFRDHGKVSQSIENRHV